MVNSLDSGIVDRILLQISMQLMQIYQVVSVRIYRLLIELQCVWYGVLCTFITDCQYCSVQSTKIYSQCPTELHELS